MQRIPIPRIELLALSCITLSVGAYLLNRQVGRLLETDGHFYSKSINTDSHLFPYHSFTCRAEETGISLGSDLFQPLQSAWGVEMSLSALMLVFWGSGLALYTFAEAMQFACCEVPKQSLKAANTEPWMSFFVHVDLQELVLCLVRVAVIVQLLVRHSLNVTRSTSSIRSVAPSVYSNWNATDTDEFRALTVACLIIWGVCLCCDMVLMLPGYRKKLADYLNPE